MYTEDTLRPPTEAEMREHYIPLETIEINWLTADSWDVQAGRKKVGDGTAREMSYEPTMIELSYYIIMNDIPAVARIVYHECGTHQLALDWMEHN